MGITKKKKIVIIFAVTILLAILLVFTEFSDIGKQQQHDRLQEHVDVCNTLPQGERVSCAFESMPEIAEYCKKYPNSDVLAGNCKDVLDNPYINFFNDLK